jgi:hypothetical protein
MELPKPLISVKEARKLLSANTSRMLNDSEVEELINQLDFIATLAVRSIKAKLQR